MTGSSERLCRRVYSSHATKKFLSVVNRLRVCPPFHPSVSDPKRTFGGDRP